MLSRTIARLATGAAITALTATLVVAPAQATQADDIARVIGKAEASVPAAALFEDTTEALPTSIGNGIDINGVAVTFDGGTGTDVDGEFLVSRGAGVTYTADDLVCRTVNQCDK